MGRPGRQESGVISVHSPLSLGETVKYLLIAVERRGMIVFARIGHAKAAEENPQLPLAVSLGARRTTPADICEMGTRNIVAALGPGSAVRVLAVTAFGVGDTRGKMSMTFKIMVRLFMQQLMADKERQEAVLKASNLDYVLVQPAGLTDAPATGDWVASAKGEVRRMRVSRKDVAAFIADEIASPLYHRQTVALSG